METALIPAPDTHPTRKARARRADRAHRTFDATAAAFDDIEAVIGGRAQLISALLHAETDADPDLAYVIGLIAAPEHDCRRLSTVCAIGDVTLGELLEAFKRGTTARVLVQTIIKTAEATPGIVEDVLARSVVHEVDCPACYGKGTVAGVDEKGARIDRLCERCDATGRVTTDPEFKRQEFVLAKLAGVTQEARGGALVNIDQRAQTNIVALDASPNGYARLMHAADQVLFGKRLLRTRTEAPTADPVYPPSAGGSPAHDPTD